MKLFDVLNDSHEIEKDKLALSCDEFTCSYNELYNLVVKMGQTLKSNGVISGHKVAIITDNPIEFVIAFFAICYADAVVLAIYDKTGNEKINSIVEEYEINHIIVGEKVSIQFSDATSEKISFDNFNFMHFNYTNNCELDQELKDVRLIIFTSGTTSLPKAIMLTDYNILSNIKSINDYLKLNDGDKLLLIKNMCHSSSIVGEMLVGITNGCSLYFTKKLPTSNTIFRIIQEKNITVFFAVPSIILAMIENNNMDHYEFCSLRIINFYGAKMSSDNIEILCRKFPQSNIIYSYGLSEASPRVTYIEKKDIIKYPGSSGRPISDVDVCIRDQEGSEVPHNVIGEITVTGPNVMKGYYKNPKLTLKVIRNNVLFTGDLGYINESGYLFVTGRKDNMIVSAGKNIYPEEIEDILSNMEGVIEALVVGEEDEKGTIELVYNICLKENSPLTKMDIFNYIKENIENYKLPKIINIVQSLEKTVSGKIKRKKKNQVVGKTYDL